jgi:Family of unknown function (DUF6090)
MIKFFRKIRQQLLSDNKFSKYLLYAVGEIVLVVFGILIALSINNWNEEKKRMSLKASYIESLRNDLQTDIVFLEEGIALAENDAKRNKIFSTRLSSNLATNDTLIKIARYEFNPIAGGPNELNRNTYNALVATGNMDLLGKELTKKLQEHNALQSNTLIMAELNFQNYLDIGNRYAGKYPTNISYNAINGPLINSFWENVNHNSLKSDFNGMLTSRIFTFSMIRNSKERLLKQTQELVGYIDTVSH